MKFEKLKGCTINQIKSKLRYGLVANHKGCDLNKWTRYTISIVTLQLYYIIIRFCFTVNYTGNVSYFNIFSQKQYYYDNCYFIVLLIKSLDQIVQPEKQTNLELKNNN